jgi:hypothetical protein
MSTKPSSDRGKLGNFLKEVINWRWDEFCEAEKDHNYTGYESAVFSLVRTCSEGKLGAIKLAIDRVDGKIETPVKIEYPKVYFLYPDAKVIASAKFAKIGTDPENTNTLVLQTPPEPTPEPELEEEPVTAATLSLRETLHKMADQPRLLVAAILHRKKAVEAGTLRENPDDPANVPLVKSVIAANLLHLAEKNNFEAITEVFDQIDGKLVETIRILGDDIYLTQYTLEAPYGAKKNKDGVYYIEAKEVAESWRQKLKDS